jgi:hypothetical protein
MAEVQVRTYFEACGKPPYKVRRVVQHAVIPRLRVAQQRW